MEMEKWRKSMVFGSSPSWSFIIMKEVFNLFTINLLSLLLPLSFLLLSRLSRAQYVLSSFDTSDSYMLFIFLYTNPTLLHILVSFVSITTLVNCISGRRIISTISINDSSLYDIQPQQQQQRRLYTAWILLCSLQVCVGLGIEGTISAGIWAIDGQENALVATREELVIQMVFFVGLHETMVHWSKSFVTPVVEDTVFGGGSFPRDESRWWLWIERLVIGGSFGGLWWWRLRDEVQGLILVGEVKRELLMGMGISDIVSWWLYYITVTIGAVKLVRGFIWFIKFLLCTTRHKIPPPTCDEKV